MWANEVGCYWQAIKIDDVEERTKTTATEYRRDILVWRSAFLESPDGVGMNAECERLK